MKLSILLLSLLFSTKTFKGDRDIPSHYQSFLESCRDLHTNADSDWEIRFWGNREVESLINGLRNKEQYLQTENFGG